MDLSRIGLLFPHCKCGVLPLNYRPEMGVEGVEPSTSSLSVKRSTGELHAPASPKPLAWAGLFQN